MKLNLNNININNCKYIVVGVSAGPDSMALLHLLQKNVKSKIVCAHINHNIRKQSIKEEKYLENYCDKNNIIFEKMKIDTYHKNNFEAEAREKRYKFYEEILNKYNTKYLFLAHHGDDLIETVLMKIARGSNIEGYAGIKKLSYYQNKFYIVRPLLDYTKDDIIKYLKYNKIKYYIDKTNKDTVYTRNRFRKFILPALKKEDINIHKKFIKYSNILLEYDNFVKKETKRICNTLLKDNYFSLNEFNKLDDFVKRNVLYYILNNIYDNIPNIITERHIDNIINLSQNCFENKIINLPKNVNIIKEYDRLIINKIMNDDKNINNNYIFKLKKHNTISNHVIEQIDEDKQDGNDVCRINSSEIKMPLYIRNKQNGDYIYVKGLNGKKKIKDIFIENKIPVRKRVDYPLLVDSDGNILWIPNLKKSKFNKKKEEKYDIILKYYEREEKNNEYE